MVRNSAPSSTLNSPRRASSLGGWPATVRQKPPCQRRRRAQNPLGLYPGRENHNSRRRRSMPARSCRHSPASLAEAYVAVTTSSALRTRQTSHFARFFSESTGPLTSFASHDLGNLRCERTPNSTVFARAEFLGKLPTGGCDRATVSAGRGQSAPSLASGWLAGT